MTLTNVFGTIKLVNQKTETLLTLTMLPSLT